MSTTNNESGPSNLIQHYILRELRAQCVLLHMNIAIWIDNVDTPQIPRIIACDTHKETIRSLKTKRPVNHGDDATPRPTKRRRDVDDPPQLPPPSPSPSSEPASDVSLESHQSGRLSPTKQLMLLEDLEQNPIVFCNFDDAKYEEPTDVFAMRSAAQRFADGIGILGRNQDTARLSRIDQMRFSYPWATEEDRNTIGETPDIAKVLTLVQKARKHSRQVEVSEDEWNSGVQLPLMELARTTSRHAQKLTIENVKMARIEPQSLARSELPGRVVDYVVSLEGCEHIERAWKHLRKTPGASIKSWNHTSKARRVPFAINIETKGPTKSWTDGKPQVAIWTDAWLKRLSLIGDLEDKVWPAVPLLIAQGHEWHLLVVSKSSNRITIWEQVAIGSTRTCFDALKVIAMLHWLMDWAEMVWRPWLLALANPLNAGR